MHGSFGLVHGSCKIAVNDAILADVGRIRDLFVGVWFACRSGGS